mmetsp:Transcript_21098/g.50066  ORF Transcript_21098/g.50066 Transcript_21098/m.50066 type:complete len:297 (-) Transcript_21098:409-1299(-)
MRPPKVAKVLSLKALDPAGVQIPRHGMEKVARRIDVGTLADRIVAPGFPLPSRTPLPLGGRFEDAIEHLHHRLRIVGAPFDVVHGGLSRWQEGNDVEVVLVGDLVDDTVVVGPEGGVPHPRGTEGADQLGRSDVPVLAHQQGEEGREGPALGVSRHVDPGIVVVGFGEELEDRPLDAPPEPARQDVEEAGVDPGPGGRTLQHGPGDLPQVHPGVLQPLQGGSARPAKSDHDPVHRSSHQAGIEAAARPDALHRGSGQEAGSPKIRASGAEIGRRPVGALRRAEQPSVEGNGGVRGG